MEIYFVKRLQNEKLKTNPVIWAFRKKSADTFVSALFD